MFGEIGTADSGLLQGGYDDGGGRDKGSDGPLWVVEEMRVLRVQSFEAGDKGPRCVECFRGVLSEGWCDGFRGRE